MEENQFNHQNECYGKQMGRKSSEDDIQDIIMQAQNAFAKKESLMSEQISEQTEELSPRQIQEQYIITTRRGIDSKLASKTKSSGRDKSPQIVFSEENQNTRRSKNESAKARNQNRATRNVLLIGTGNSDGMYVDTNLDKNEQELQRNYTPEPFKQIMREDVGDLSSTKKEGQIIKKIHKIQLPKLGERTISNVSSQERLTGHFNTKLIKNCPEGFQQTEQFNIHNADSNLGSQTNRDISARQSLYPSTKRDLSPMQQYRKRRFMKSLKRTDGFNSRGSDQSQNSDIQKYSEMRQTHQRNNSKSSSQTRFSINFGQLINKITDIYPSFAKVANSKDLNPQLLPEDMLHAENMFNQLNFMYQRAVEYAQEEEKNATLKFSCDNAEREIAYYSNQLNVFKNQLQTAAMREQQTEVNYEKRLEYLNNQMKQYEQSIDQLQTRLDNSINEKERENQSQISFRDTKNDRYAKNGHDANFFQLTADKTPKMTSDCEPRIQELSYEIKDLKTKLKYNEEQFSFEKETNQMLMDKIDKMNEAFKNQISTYQKESGHLKNQAVDKCTQLKQLEDQIDQLARCAQLEFPIVIRGRTGKSTHDQIPKPEQNTNVPKFIDMKKQTKSPFLEDLEMDLDEIMNSNIFGGDIEQDEIQLSSLPNTRKVSKNNKNGAPRNKSQINVLKQTQNPQVLSMFSLSDSFKQQMSAVLIADEIMKSMKSVKGDQLKKIDTQLQVNQKFNDKVKQFQLEKMQMAGKLAELTKDNESLKLKFSQLLDQFQEYVNESERKTEEDQLNHKSEQEKLLSDLNTTIKELDDMSKSLQQDVQEKQQQIEQLYQEQEQMIEQLKEADEQNNVAISNEEVHKVQIKSLNEEIKYIKQQYMMELEALRGENGSLHTKMRDRSSEAQNNRRFQNHQRSQSPYEMNEDQAIQQMHLKYEDSVIEHGCEYIADSKLLNRNQSQMQMNSNQTNSTGVRQSRDRDNRWKEHDQDLQDCIYDAKDFRSKSQDRVVGGIHDIKKHQNFDLHSSQIYEEKKREMLDKDRLIEQKNKEIVKLRMENDDFRQMQDQPSNQNQNIQNRIQIIDEIEDFLENIKIEMDKTKSNLYKPDSQHQQQPKFNDQKSYKKYQTEDSLLQALFDKIQTMRNLMALASEIYLLSTQNKYARTNFQQPHPSNQLGMIKVSELDYQKLVQENSHLERLISQYEQTIAKFEFISQNPDDQSGLVELQRLSQQYLQQIGQLQSEIASMQEEINSSQNFGTQHNQIQKLTQENRVLKQEVQSLRECDHRAQNIQNGNEELMVERKQLIGKIDQFEQVQSQLNLQVQDSQLQVADKDAQLEELRTRITTIAELFEKKRIKQRYSFEVLCDFVHDKAKRLFTKYENAVKDKKQLQQDDKQQRKIYKLEQEMQSLNEVKSCVVPMMMSLLNRELSKEDLVNANIEFIKKLAQDIEYEFKRQFKEIQDNSQTIKSNLRQIESLQTGYDQYQNENRHPNNYNCKYSPVGPSRGPTNISTCNDDQIKIMQQEKNQLHMKIDEFSHVLKEFQNNQRQFEVENQQLKVKIQQLEGSGINKEQTDRYSHQMRHSGNMLSSLGTGNDHQILTLGQQMNSCSQNRRNENGNFHQLSLGTNHNNFNQSTYSGNTHGVAGYVGGVIQQVSPSPIKTNQNI